MEGELYQEVEFLTDSLRKPNQSHERSSHAIVSPSRCRFQVPRGLGSSKLSCFSEKKEKTHLQAPIMPSLLELSVHHKDTGKHRCSRRYRARVGEGSESHSQDSVNISQSQEADVFCVRGLLFLSLQMKAYKNRGTVCVYACMHVGMCACVRACMCVCSCYPAG